MGDRWDMYALQDSRYVWLPVTPDDERGALEMKWHDVWAIDVKTSEWWVPEGTAYEAESGEVVGGARVAVSVSGRGQSRTPCWGPSVDLDVNSLLRRAGRSSPA